MTLETSSKENSTNGPSESYERLSATQRATLSRARQLLLNDVIGFLQKTTTKRGEAELGHKPQSEDLVPFFQKYLWTLVKVYLGDKLASFSSEDELRKSIEKFIPRAVKSICKNGKIEEGSISGGGTWWRTVDRACDAVNLGVRHGPFGAVDRFAFLHPNRAQLRALLFADAHQLIAEFWQHRAGLENTSDEYSRSVGTAALPSNPAAPAGEYPERARWLQDRLAERGWNLSTFDKQGSGISRKTVSLIAKGKPVARSSLTKLVHALSTYKALPTVRFSEIPTN